MKSSITLSAKFRTQLTSTIATTLVTDPSSRGYQLRTSFAILEALSFTNEEAQELLINAHSQAAPLEATSPAVHNAGTHKARATRSITPRTEEEKKAAKAARRKARREKRKAEGAPGSSRRLPGEIAFKDLTPEAQALLNTSRSNPHDLPLSWGDTTDDVTPPFTPTEPHGIDKNLHPTLGIPNSTVEALGLDELEEEEALALLEALDDDDDLMADS